MIAETANNVQSVLYDISRYVLPKNYCLKFTEGLVALNFDYLQYNLKYKLPQKKSIYFITVGSNLADKVPKTTVNPSLTLFRLGGGGGGVVLRGPLPPTTFLCISPSLVTKTKLNLVTFPKSYL